MKIYKMEGGASVTVLSHDPGTEFRPQRMTPPEPIQLPKQDLVWQPDSALFIGVGGSGYRICSHVMKNLCDAGKNKLPEGVRFLAINTNEYEKIDEEDPLSFAGFSIPDEDIFVLDENLKPVVENWLDSGDTPPEYKDWFNVDEFPLDEMLDLRGGTRGDRRLARLAFLRNICGATRFSNWQTTRVKEGMDAGDLNIDHWLKERCQDVIRDNRIRIILAGSLAGGMSGIFSDLAILAKKMGLEVLGEGGSVSVEAFLLDSQPFTGIDGGMADKKRDANCYAALREINRWQVNFPTTPLSPGWRMENDELVRKPLFDRFYLFSKPLRPGGDLGAPTEPVERLAKWIVPAVADTISIMMDTAAGAEGPADFFAQGETLAADRRQREHQSMASRVGVYTVRFPIADILKSVHAQLQLELILSRLTGERNGDVNFDPYAVTTSSLPGEPSSAIHYFLSGELDEVVDGEVSTIERMVLSLLQDRVPDAFEQAESEIDLREVELQLSQRLDSMVVYILLATPGGQQHDARAAYIAYALAFLEAFEQQVQLKTTDLPNREYPQEEFYIKILGLYAALLQRRIRSLQELKSLLVRTVADGSSGLVDVIKDRAAALDTYIGKMDEIYCRKYIWKANGAPCTFRDQWMESISAQVINAGNLSRLNWVMTDFDTEEGVRKKLDLELLVIPDGCDTTVRLRRDGIDAFITAFEYWMGSLTCDIWNQNVLGPVIDAEELFFSEDDGRRVANIVQPLNDHNSVNDPGAGSPMLYELVPNSILDRFVGQNEFNEELLHALTSMTSLAVEVRSALITDPLSAVFLFDQDAICVKDMRTVQHMKSVYDAVDDFDQQRRQFTNAYKHEFAVFRADHEARLVEKESGEMPNHLYHPYDEWGLLHPLVVNGLQSPEKAELYCLAIADGLVGRNNRGELIINTGINGSSLRYPPRGKLDPFLDGLLRFTLEHRNRQDVDNITNELKARFDDPQHNRGQIQNWTQTPPIPWTADTPEMESFTHLIVFLARFYCINRERRWRNG